MCEINPKQTKILRLEFFTSAPLTKKEFEDIVAEKCVNMELNANSDMRIRCHIHEVEL